jgi:Pectate lyase superfamily protein
LPDTNTSPFYNVMDYNATGDGATDDTAAINSAIADAAAPPKGGTGNVVFLPGGTYRINSSLVVPPAVTLQGAGWNTPGAETDVFAGSWLFVPAGAGFSPVSIPGAGGFGGAVRNLGFNVYNQSTAGAPAVAEPMIHITANNVLVEDVCLYNPYGGIFIDGGAQATIRRVFGQPIQFGIKIDNSDDTNHIDTVHFWTYWQGSGTPVGNYQLANGTAIGLFRCDNPLINDVFALHYNVGLSLSQSGYGIPHKVHLSNADFDGCVMGVHIMSPGSTTDRATLQMSNVTMQAPAGTGNPTGNGIWIEAGSAYTQVQATNLRITNSGQNGIQIDAGNVNFYGEDVYIENWGGSYGFYIPSTTSYAWLGVGFGYSSGGTPYAPAAQFHLAQHS